MNDAHNDLMLALQRLEQSDRSDAALAQFRADVEEALLTGLGVPAHLLEGDTRYATIDLALAALEKRDVP